MNDYFEWKNYRIVIFLSKRLKFLCCHIQTILPFIRYEAWYMYVSMYVCTHMIHVVLTWFMSYSPDSCTTHLIHVLLTWTSAHVNDSINSIACFPEIKLCRLSLTPIPSKIYNGQLWKLPLISLCNMWETSNMDEDFLKKWS